MAREDKATLLTIFEEDFKLTRKDAAGLLISSAHLLGSGSELSGNVAKFLSPSSSQFTPEQSKSAVTLLERIAGPSEQRHPNAETIVTDALSILSPPEPEASTW